MYRCECNTYFNLICGNKTTKFYERIDKFEGAILPLCDKCYFNNIKYIWTKVTKPSTEKEYIRYNKTRILQ